MNHKFDQLLVWPLVFVFELAEKYTTASTLSDFDSSLDAAMVHLSISLKNFFHASFQT